eukprot:3528076-Pyramimonas_sp.AAC.1
MWSGPEVGASTMVTATVAIGATGGMRFGADCVASTATARRFCSATARATSCSGRALAEQNARRGQLLEPVGDDARVSPQRVPLSRLRRVAREEGPPADP